MSKTYWFVKSVPSLRQNQLENRVQLKKNIYVKKNALVSSRFKKS